MTWTIFKKHLRLAGSVMRSSDKYKHVTHPQHSRYVEYGGFHVLLRVSFFRFWNYARFDASKDCDDEDVDWEHEETALHAHHEVLPGHLY